MGAPRVDWQAEKRVAKKRARVMTMMADPRGEVTCEVWLSSYMELFPSDRSVKAEREHLGMLRAFRREHGALKVSAVTPLLAQQWATVNPGQVRHLSRAWHGAMQLGIAEVNVWKLVTRPRREKESVRPPSELELRGILNRCQGRGFAGETWWRVFADLVEVAAYTGAREGGLIALKRPAVDLAAGRVTVTEKGGKTRTIVLLGSAREAMARRLADYPPCLPDRQYVFRNQRRERLSAFVVQEAWRKVRGEFPHGFHSLRHYAATWLRAQGVDAEDVAIQLGHTDAAGRPRVQLQQRVYNHPDPELALQRIERAVA